MLRKSDRSEGALRTPIDTSPGVDSDRLLSFSLPRQRVWVGVNLTSALQLETPISLSYISDEDGDSFTDLQLDLGLNYFFGMSNSSFRPLIGAE